MKVYKVTLWSFNTDSSFNIELTEKEYELLKLIENVTANSSLTNYLTVKEKK